jgi:hypothetical protein
MEIPSNEILSLEDYLECGSYDDFFKVSIIDTDAMTFLNRIRLVVSSPRKDLAKVRIFLVLIAVIKSAIIEFNL